MEVIKKANFKLKDIEEYKQEPTPSLQIKMKNVFYSESSSSYPHASRSVVMKL